MSESEQLKQYGDKQWWNSISFWTESVKLRVTAYWGPLVILDKGRKKILFTCSQVKLGWSQNHFLGYFLDE